MPVPRSNRKELFGELSADLKLRYTSISNSTQQAIAKEQQKNNDDSMMRSLLQIS